MISAKDEFLHEFKKSPDWQEIYSVNFVDRKNKIYGFADINYHFHVRRVEFLWALFYNDSLYSYNSHAEFDGLPASRIHADRGFRYKVVSPLEKIELSLKNESVSAGFTVIGAYPVYNFPAHLPSGAGGQGIPEMKLWERYEQRCRVSGSISVAGWRKKGHAKRVDCIGHRKHSWGERLPERLSCYSWITVQFRDMAMDLTYLEIDRVPYSNGFISRRTGNIPITSVEMELLSLSRESRSLQSTEFSYRDAQDDRDLIVSKRLHSFEMPLPKNKRQRFVRFRAFSEFTVIGTNKKGIGMEEHYISLEKMKNIEQSIPS